MRLLRFLANLILAAVLIVVSVTVMFTGYGVVMARAWENTTYDAGVETGTWAVVDQRPIYYRTWGPETGAVTTIVLIHGLNAEGSLTWNTTAQTLAKAGMRVVALDLKGFGHSARDLTSTYTLADHARVVARILEQIKVSKAAVIGHGRGCAVALQVASDYSNLVERLVLLAPQVYSDPLATVRLAAKVPYLGRAVAWAMTSGEPFWSIIRRQGLYDASVLTKAYADELREPTHVVGTIAALLAMAASPLETKLPEKLSSVKVPTLILVGRHDRYTPLAESQRLSKALSGARMVVFPEAGHYLHIEQSTNVNRAITDFCLSATP